MDFSVKVTNIVGQAGIKLNLGSKSVNLLLAFIGIPLPVIHGVTVVDSEVYRMKAVKT